MSDEPADTPSIAVRLDHASVMTPDLDAAADFYTTVLGLQLRTVTDDPVRKGRRQALLMDGAGHDIVELIEMPEMAHPSVPGRGGVHHLGFRLSDADWHTLRARLDAQQYPYQEKEGRLFIRDADGLVLEVEHT
ncbi:VOC family protein [Salisaeta longa]|uniref:VOC family protein n=1 Tax=Salisaeta longa TaxID=503170 RepID=UPI0003B68FF8|nr:VOC family protein [Salisaeta longa]